MTGLKRPDGGTKFPPLTRGIPAGRVMETHTTSNIGQKGRFYLTKNIWLPQEPIENLNLKMSDIILRRMPKLPLAADDALKIFPVLGELKKSHDKIKADLQYLLSHHEEIPALHEVHPRDLYVAGRDVEDARMDLIDRKS